MIEALTATDEAGQAILERRRARARLLRSCTRTERLFLKQLPESRYSPYAAGKALRMSTRTVHVFLKKPRVMKAMATFLEDALDQIGISHASLVADLVAIKTRCMQAEPVLDNKGNPTGEYQFDSRGAIAAIREIAELVKLAPPKRLDLTMRSGEEQPAPMFSISFEDGGPGDYGIEVSGKIGTNLPTSADILN